MGRKLTYEYCKELSKSFKYYTDFRDTDLSAFRKCKDNNWLNDFTWLINNLQKYDLNAKIHKIYAYEFTDFKSVYVGRTIQITQRHYSHFHPKGEKKDTVRDFCIENNIVPFRPTLIEDNLTLEESQIKEKYWCDKYVENGWNLLNKGKTGLHTSSIGGIGIKWTEEKCYEEAKKYSFIIDFRNNASQAYKVSLKREWIKNYTWLKRKHHEKNYWTYEKCYEEAKKYKTLSTLRIENGSLYAKACKNGWIDDYNWLEKNHYSGDKLTYEKCYEEAKKYSEVKEFRDNDGLVYVCACRNGWINDYNWLIKESEKRKINAKIKKEERKRIKEEKLKEKKLQLIEKMLLREKNKIDAAEKNKIIKEELKKEKNEIKKDLIARYREEKTKIIKQRAFEKFGDKIDTSILEYTGPFNKIKFICHKHGIQEVCPDKFLKSPCGCKLCSFEQSKKGYIGDINELEKILRYTYGDKSYIDRTTFKSYREKCYVFFEKGQRLDKNGGKWVYPENIKQAYKNKLRKNP